MKTQTVQIALHIFTDLWKIKIFLEGNRVNLIMLVTLMRLYVDCLSKFGEEHTFHQGNSQYGISMVNT